MKTTTRKLVFSGLFAALCCVITMYPKFPTLFGYIHAGDAFVLLCAFILGPQWGALAAGLGSGLADLIAGYVQYVPGTVIIKAAMALVAGAILTHDKKQRISVTVFSGICAELIMMLGYFGYESLILGYGIAAAGSIPTNLVQGVFGVAASTALHAALIKSKRFKYLHK